MQNIVNQCKYLVTTYRIITIVVINNLISYFIVVVWRVRGVQNHPVPNCHRSYTPSRTYLFIFC